MKTNRWLITMLAIGLLCLLYGCASGTGGSASSDRATDAASYAKPEFHTIIEDGRLWVFREGSPELQDFRDKGELAKHVIRPGAGPGGITLKAPDAETITLYLASKPGFSLAMDDGRLWVFKAGSKELEDFRSQGELAKHVIRPGAGPGGITLKAPDAETLDDYLQTR